jgi:hypothetical protein
MEWLLVLAALACPIGMLAMGAIAWMIGKRTGQEPGREETADSASKGPGREGLLTPRS